MKFTDTSSAKDYGLTLADVEIEVTHGVNYVPTVLIVPQNDEFPIEAIETKTAVEAHQLVNLLNNRS